MIRRPPSGTASRVPYDLMLCSTYDCPTIGSPLDLVEREVYNALSDWVEGYRLSGQMPSKSLIPEKEVLFGISSTDTRSTSTAKGNHV